NSLIARLSDKFRQARYRHPEIRVRKFHHFGHDADYGRLDLVHTYHFAEYRRVHSIPAVPNAVADNDDCCGTVLIVVRNEVSPDDWIHAEHPERVRGEVGAVVPLRRPSGISDVHGSHRPCCEIRKTRLRIAPVAEIEPGSAEVTAGSPILLAYIEDAVRVF